MAKSYTRCQLCLHIPASVLYGVVIVLLSGLLHCSTPPSSLPRHTWKVRLPATHPIIGVEQSPPRIITIDNRTSFSRPAGRPSVIGKDTNISHPFFRQYRSEQGLPTNSVLCSTVDKEGSLWFGTVGSGICRFDGSGFTSYSIANGLPSSVVLSVMKDADDNLWIGTTSGLCKYDGYRFNTFAGAEKLVGSFITCLAQDTAHHIWIGTQEGKIVRYDGQHFQDFSPKDGLPIGYPQCMLVDREGRLWIGRAGGGILRFDGEKFTAFNAQTGLASDFVYSMIQDKDGILWFGTADGISRYDGSRFSGHNELKGSAITCLQEGKDGEIWLCARNRGIMKYGTGGFTNYGSIPGWLASNITSIAKGIDGKLWFTSIGDGISRYSDNNLLNFMMPQSLTDNTFFCFTRDRKGNLWVGTKTGGVARYDGHQIIQITSQQGLPDNWIWDVFQDRENNYWFATNNGGVTVYNGKQFTNYNVKNGLVSNAVTRVFQARGGDIWLATLAGVNRIDKRHITTYTTQQGLAGNHVQAISEDDSGNLWFATHDNGVSRFDGKQFANFTTDHGLASNTVYSMLRDKTGILWFGTSRGVTRFDGRQFSTFTVKDGLPDDIIWAMAEDSARGLLWLGTNNGLAVLHEDAVGGPPNIKARFEVLNRQSNYPIKHVPGGALFVDKESAVWMISEFRNLIRLEYPDFTKKKNRPLRVKVKAVKVNNESLCWSALPNGKTGDAVMDSLTVLNETASGFINGTTPSPAIVRTKYPSIRFDSVMRYDPVPANLTLPYYNNTVNIEFGVAEPRMDGQIKYSYYLSDYSKNWSEPSSNTSAAFGNIRPGNHILTVNALSPTGERGTIAYAFTILTPWWASWWAYLLYFISGASLIYIVYRRRMRAIELEQARQIHIMAAGQEIERSRIARDLHDDVGVKLSALKLFLSSLSEKISLSHSEEIASLAANSQNLVREAMQDVRRLLVNLSPGVLEEFGYLTAVKTLISKVNETGSLHFDLSTFGIEKRLEKDFELTLYRMTQELINNVLKHSGAKNVSLQIGIRDERIMLMIEDDGKGFDIRNVKDGNGLHNLRIRTRLMKGTIDVDTRPGKGTSITIELPYKNYQP